MADATRVRIVLALKEGELSVNRLADVAGKSPAAVPASGEAAAGPDRDHPARGEPSVLPASERAHLELVTDAMLQAEHSLDNQARHRLRTQSEM